MGYRWYATKNISPLYPFGHGLSYANFQYSALQAKINKSQVDVSFTLDNIGKMNAEEVAQVYITRPQSAIERPAHELKGFQRVALKAGGTVVPLGRKETWLDFRRRSCHHQGRQFL